MLNSYPKVYNLGHKAITELFFDPVLVQEKLDGSQISFGFVDGVLQIRSHHSEIEPEGHYEGMFEEAVQTIKHIASFGGLKSGWIYRGEYFKKPRQNTLSYSRIPKNHIIIFDINPGLEDYLDHDEVKKEVEPLGFEVVPTYEADLTVDGYEKLNEYLERESILGGTSVEGVVFKNYLRFGRDKHVLMGKWVSEKFKESNKVTHKIKNKLEVIEELGNQYRAEARWNKAIQHLREKGLLSDEPKDIGPLMKELSIDLKEECGEEIKEKLFHIFWKKISKYPLNGFPQYYKNLLAKRQFGGHND